MSLAVERLLSELARAGTLLLITGGGWLVYAAGELNVAPCPTCGRMAGFYAIRQVLDSRQRLVWEGYCLGCARVEASELLPSAVREQEPEGHNSDPSNR